VLERDDRRSVSAVLRCARDASTICVVEQPRDVEALERAGVYRGRYHVLMGALNPAEGSEEGSLTIPRLVARVRTGAVGEVILATDPDAEGEATALAVLEALERAGLATARDAPRARAAGRQRDRVPAPRNPRGRPRRTPPSGTTRAAQPRHVARDPSPPRAASSARRLKAPGPRTDTRACRARRSEPRCSRRWVSTS
jgi:5S rRNA maturation endonuclease (ribonuclease M5)